MRRMGIEALAPQPGTSEAAPGNKIYPYLLRKLAIVRANQVRALDTTSTPMAKGFVYLTAVVDVASRRVLTHKVAVTREACHARETIEEAFARFGMPEIVNTVQGSQFTAEELTNAVLSKGVKLSMDGRGAWRDNVFVERLCRSVKYERVYLMATTAWAPLVSISPNTSFGTTPIARTQVSIGQHRSRPMTTCCPNWHRLHRMKSLVRPELPTASVGSSQVTTAAVDNSAPLATRPQSTYRSGKVVQTTGATSIGMGLNRSRNSCILQSASRYATTSLAMTKSRIRDLTEIVR